MELISLREMCELLKVSRRSVQCYKKEGLMQATCKNKYGHLLYDRKTVERAEKIRFLQQLGFKLKEVKQIIDAPDDVLKESIKERLEKLEVEQSKLNKLIHEAMDYIGNQSAS